MGAFVSKKELLAEIVKSKVRFRENPTLKAAAMTPRLAELLSLMVDRFSSKSSWAGYSYVDEMRADALVHLCDKWHKFDELRFDNPFAYFTEIIKRCFIMTLSREKKVQGLKDGLLEYKGRSPSTGRQVENEIAFKEQLLE